MWLFFFPVWAACSPSQARILTRYGSAVWTLGRMSNLHIYCPTGADTTCSAPPPEGSLIGVVDHTCQLHLQVEVCSLSVGVFSHLGNSVFEENETFLLSLWETVTSPRNTKGLSPNLNSINTVDRYRYLFCR